MKNKKSFFVKLVLILLVIKLIVVSYFIGYFNGKQSILPDKVIQDTYLNGYRTGWFAGMEFMKGYVWERYNRMIERHKK